MARKPRIHHTAGIYHVSLAGKGGAKIFGTDADRKYFEALIEEGVQRFGHKVHGYCLMPNQLNLVIQVGDVSLSKIMQNLSFRFTRYFNKAHGGDGHLFQGRYKAILVQDEFLAELVAYVHAAPVRASARAKVDTYKWSGQKAYLGKEKKDWVYRDDVYAALAKREATAMKRYVELSAKAVKDGERVELERGNDGAVLGDKDFHKEVRKAPRKKAKPVTLDKLLKHVLKGEGVKKEAELATESRARGESLVRQIVAFLAVELGSATLTEVSSRFNRDLTTMSRNLRNFRDRMGRDADLAKRVEEYRKALAK